MFITHHRFTWLALGHGILLDNCAPVYLLAMGRKGGSKETKKQDLIVNDGIRRVLYASN